MKPSISWALLTAVLILASASSASAVELPGNATSAIGASSHGSLCAPAMRATELRLVEPEAGARWIVDRADNICGLDDAKMLSKPAKVDYDALLKATAEMKKIRDDKIDPSSPEGIRLRQAAADRVRSAADKVRVAEGYCSIWKQIRHQDGRVIPDVTDQVKAQL